MYIINDTSEAGFVIPTVEDKYNAKYMGSWALRTRDGAWAEVPSAIFYVENPDRSLGHTNYFGLFTRGSSTYITKGDSAFTDLTGVLAKDGEVVISRYRHDYRGSSDDSVWIDGGRDYLRYNGVSKVVSVEVVDGKFYVDGEEVTNGS